MNQSNTLETLRDNVGVVELGWVAPKVFLAQFEGGLSASLGKAFAGRLEEAVRGRQEIEYFGDGSRVTHYDLEARSALVRVLTEQGRCFSSITVLLWQGELSGQEASVAATIDDPSMLTDADEFQRRVLRVAPNARDRLLKRFGGREYVVR